MDSNNWYLEYAIGSISNRMHLCKLEEFNEILAYNIGGEIYRSMFLYSEDIVDHIVRNDSVSGFDGIQGIDKIVMDVDLEHGESAGQNTIDKCKRLLGHIETLKVEPKNYNLWFSGSGFHVHMADVYNFKSDKNLARQVRATMQRDFGKYIDNIYDGRRLIRAGYSLNKKTGLYKTPISIKELQNRSCAEIAELSRKIRSSDNYKHAKLIKPKEAVIVPVNISKKNIKKVRKVFDSSKSETSRYITCSQHIFNAGFVNKGRHKHLLRLVSIWMTKYGFSKQACDNLASAYMNQMSTPLSKKETEKIVSDVFKGGYNYGCMDEVLSQYCDSKCVLFKYKNLDEKTDVMNAEDMTHKLLEYLTADFTDRSFQLDTVFPHCNSDHLFKTGELVTLIGDTGLGKTAFWQYIVTRLKHMNTLFLSLEVDDVTMIRRFMQASLGMTKKDIIAAFRNNNIDIIEQALSETSHIKLLTSSPDITEYSEMISEHKPRILVVDTIDRVPAKFVGKDEFTRQEYVVNKLKDLTNKEDILILAVHHISKSASYRMKETGRLDVHSGKGNSAIEQKSDQFISFTGSQDNKIRIIRSLKARDDSLFEIALNYNYETFTFDKRD